MLLSVVYHPDITVRTAYDLKPCRTVSHLAMIIISSREAYVYYDLGDPHGGGLRIIVVDVVSIKDGKRDAVDDFPTRVS